MADGVRVLCVDDEPGLLELVRIFLEDGTFVNEWMVEKGYAFAYTSFPFKYMKHFVALERQARSLELGLWNSTVCPYY